MGQCDETLKHWFFFLFLNENDCRLSLLSITRQSEYRYPNECLKGVTTLLLHCHVMQLEQQVRKDVVHSLLKKRPWKVYCAFRSRSSSSSRPSSKVENFKMCCSDAFLNVFLLIFMHSICVYIYCFILSSLTMLLEFITGLTFKIFGGFYFIFTLK